MEIIEEEERLLRQFEEQIEEIQRKLQEEITIDKRAVEYFERIRGEIDSAIFFLRKLKGCIERGRTSKSDVTPCLKGFKTKIEAAKGLLKAEEALKVKKIGLYNEINNILILLEKLFSALEKRIPQYNV